MIVIALPPPVSAHLRIQTDLQKLRGYLCLPDRHRGVQRPTPAMSGVDLFPPLASEQDLGVSVG